MKSVSEMSVGDLSHLPFGSPELPYTYYEVEAWAGHEFRISQKFSNLPDARKALEDIKTTTLKHIIKWTRPAEDTIHRMKWTQP